MSRGFTLFELLIVLIIISLVSALVAPRMIGHMTSINLRTATQKTAAVLKYARNLAASEKAVCIVVFDFDEQTLYIVHGENEDDQQKQDLDGNEKKVDSRTYDFPDGITLEKAIMPGGEEKNAGQYRLLFFPNGSSRGGDVFLSNNKGRRYNINIDFITGLVSSTAVDRSCR
jgi:general secretion pathway protein H